MRFYFVFVLALMLFSCDSTSDQNLNVAYFGGEIDNPKNDYVTFNRSESDADTLTLDADNRFMFQVEGIEPGLYWFTHGGEYQLVVLEPNDSIVLRLNTRDFDESLVFSGKGAKKNNYLMKLYLDHEDSHKELLTKLNLEPELFHSFIDSIRNSELEELKNFNVAKGTSEYYKEISEGFINYHYYFYKEIYPFGYYGYNRLIHFKDLPDNFYSYRDEVDLNDKLLVNLPVYKGYLEWYFKNIALNEVYKSGDHSLKFNKQSLTYNKAKLKLIDSLIEEPKIKDYLLTNVTREFIVESEDTTKIKNLAEQFYTLVSAEGNKEFINEMVVSRLNFKSGEYLPNVILIDTNNDMVKLRELINKPSVIFFWSTNQIGNAKRSHNVIAKLKSKYEGINFIGINVNEYQPIYWNETIREHNFDIENEYYFKYAIDGAIALSADLENVIIADVDGKIIDVHVGLFNDDLSQSLGMMEKMDLVAKRTD